SQIAYCIRAMKRIVALSLLLSCYFALNAQTNRKQYTVYFDNASAELISQSKQTLDSVIQVAQNSGYYRLMLRAYADPNGEKEYNMRLSELRNHSVLEYLLEAGIDSAVIQLKSYGEEEKSRFTSFPEYRRVELL